MNADVETAAPPPSPFVKTLLTLWALSLVGIACVLPYTVTLQRKVLDLSVARLHWPLWKILALSLMQSAVLFLALIAAGLWAARRVGFQTPLIRAALTRTRVLPRTLSTLAVVFAVGAALGVAILGLDRFVFTSFPSVAALIQAASTGETHAPAWQGLLASFYGGFDEELLMRLGLVSLFTLALRRPFGATAAFWVANIVAAILFGLAHLPTAAALAPVTTAVVARTIVLNGLVGVVAGAYYRRFGLEWAVALHFGADIVLHVLAA